jgi:MFS family permease
MVTVPNYLSTISPQRFKKAFGAAHQMTIGLGMIIAQSLSFAFDAPFKWRYSLLVAVGLSVLVFVVALGKSDSVPADHGQAEEGTALLPRDKGE